MDDIKNGIVIRRCGDAHPQGREDIKTFEYRDGQPVAAFYGSVIGQLFGWAEAAGVDLRTLAQQTPQLRQLVELSGGRVTAGT